MPIDTVVAGDPASIRSSAQWLRTLSEAVHNSGTGIRGAVGQSESAWQGPSGDAFRGRMGQAVGQADELAANLAGAGDAMDLHAANLDTVRSRLAQARGVALAAGLVVTDTAICEPAGPPAAPPEVPKGRCPSTAEREAIIAVDAFAEKCKAFVECLTTAAEARQIEANSQATLLSVMTDKAKSPMTWVDFASGAYAGYLTTKLAKMRESVANLGNAADATAASARAAAANPALPQSLVRTVVQQKLDSGLKYAVAKREAETLFGGSLPKDQSWLAKAGRDTRFWLTQTMGDTRWGASLLANAPKVVKDIPLLGLGMTAGTTGWSIYQDPKNPENVITSLVAGGGSLVAATAVGGMFAATAPFWLPLAAGGLTALVVDVGVTWAAPYVFDHAGDLADWAGDKAGDLWHGATNVVNGVVTVGGLLG